MQVACSRYQRRNEDIVMKLFKELNRLLNDEEGLTTVEYAIAGGVIAAGIVGVFTQLGTEVDAKMTDVCKELATDDSKC